MFLSQLAAHPRTGLEVLNVLAHGNNLPAAATALARTGQDIPEDVLDALSYDQRYKLMARPELSATARRTLLATGYLDDWSPWARTTAPTRDDLRHLTQLASDKTATEEYNQWLVLLATHPNADPVDAIDLYRRAPEAAELRTWPATALTLVDNHHLPADTLPTSGETPEPVRKALAAYYANGCNLAETLSGSPMTTETPETRASWMDVVRYTTNRAVAVEAARRAATIPELTPGASPAVCMQLILSNPRLPDLAYADIARIMFTHPQRVRPTTLGQLFDLLAGRPHIGDTELLDMAVATVTPSTVTHLLTHPRLTKEHLTHLTWLMGHGMSLRSVIEAAALVSTHPNTDPTLIKRARVHLPSSDIRQALPDLAARLQVARGKPIHADTLGPAGTLGPVGDPALTSSIEDVFARHPALHTDPNLVTAVAALITRFDGTLNEMVNTAAGIAN